MIEAMVVVVILGILVSTSVIVFLGQRKAGWRSSVDSDVNQAVVVLNDAIMNQSVTEIDYATTTTDSSSTTEDSTPTVITASNATGNTPTTTVYGRKIIVSKGNILTITINSDSFTVTGTNVNLSGWSWSRTTSRNGKTWSKAQTPDPNECVIAPVSTGSTILQVGGLGKTCKVTVDHVEDLVAEYPDTTQFVIVGGVEFTSNSDGNGLIFGGVFEGFDDLTKISICTSSSDSCKDDMVDASSKITFQSGYDATGFFANDGKLDQFINFNSSTFDTSNIVNMDYMFKNDKTINSYPQDMNVSNVTSMVGIFEGNTNFNQDLSSWDTSKVTDMSYAFANSGFNSTIWDWDVSSVTDMSYMFYDNTKVNGNPYQWGSKTGKVTTTAHMFDGAKNFNGKLSNGSGTKWDLSSLKDASYMFANAKNFSGYGLKDLDVSSVTDMAHMFENAVNDYGTGDASLSSWTPSSALDMTSMFNGASNFSSDLSLWTPGTGCAHAGFATGSKITLQPSWS